MEGPRNKKWSGSIPDHWNKVEMEGPKKIKNGQVQYPTIETKWRWRGQRNKKWSGSIPDHWNVVEMEGIEPSSKQGSHTLSTCLFLPSVFVMQQDQDHQLHPYPLKFHQQSEASAGYSRFYSTADQNASGQVAFWAMSRSPAWRGN